MISLRLILMILGLICFLLSALGISTPRGNLQSAGLFFWLLAVMIVGWAVVIVRLVETAAGVPTEFDGKFVVEYDPSYRLPDGSYDGGILEVTDDPDQALQFPTVGEALAKWKQAYGMDWNGEPNRPLCAWTIEIVNVEKEWPACKE